MTSLRSSQPVVCMPAKAQVTGVLGFLFNLLDLLTQVFALFSLIRELFPGDDEEVE